ncbi:MAG TPA: type III-B CRISPR module RAMP protein Cmr1 [Thermotogae bacterium]|nr:type III-B CRISPR module RAMP protein Cmr1 [Thermotogota bacterium]
MFSRGAQPARNGVYPFELRPQSVKGVLRFWFRALAPLVIDVNYLDVNKLAPKEREIWKDEKSYPGLKYLESLLFGSQHQESPFALSVDWNIRDEKAVGRYEHNRKGRLAFAADGELDKLKYSFYGTYDIKEENGDRRFMYSYLPSDSELTLEFFVRNKKDKQIKDDEILEVLLSILHLVSTFSGFGAKTHKGYGAFELIEPAMNRDPQKFGSIVEKAESALKKFITSHPEISKLFKIEPTKFQTIPDFPNFAARTIFIIPSIRGRNWSEVMRQMYFTSRDDKGWYPKLKNQLRKYNGDVVKDLIKSMNSNRGSVVVKPSILGLPLQYQRLQTEKRNKITFFAHVETEDKNRGRKGSPLHISIHKDQNGWYPVLLLLKSKITQPVNSKLLLEKDYGRFEALGYDNFETLETLIKKSGGVRDD